MEVAGGFFVLALSGCILLLVCLCYLPNIAKEPRGFSGNWFNPSRIVSLVAFAPPLLQVLHLQQHCLVPRFRHNDGAKVYLLLQTENCSPPRCSRSNLKCMTTHYCSLI